VVNNHGDSDRKSPKDQVVPLPNGLVMAYKMGVILATYKSWDDPPSMSPCKFKMCFPVLEVGHVQMLKKFIFQI